MSYARKSRSYLTFLRRALDHERTITSWLSSGYTANSAVVVSNVAWNELQFRLFREEMRAEIRCRVAEKGSG